MKNCLVHCSSAEATQNRSASATRQRVLLGIGLAIIGARTCAQIFPDAQQILANVRIRQSQQQIDLRGQLRQDARIVPFRLVQSGPVIRYIFNNPDETLQLKLGAGESRLEEIARTGSEKIPREKLQDRIRDTSISYEDLALKFLYWPNARTIGADFIRTRNCWKVQLFAPSPESEYASVLLWVDKDNGALMRMEGYDGAGKLVKRFEVVSAQKIEDRWYLKQMRVESIDPQSNKAVSRTYLEINK